MRKAALLAFFLFCAMQVFGQWTIVSGSHVYDASDPTVPYGLFNGKIFITAVNAQLQPIAYRIGGEGQGVQTAYSAHVTDGIFSILVPDSHLTAPVVCYKIQLQGRIGTVRTDLVCEDSNGNGGITGTNWNYDTYIPSTAPNVSGQSIENLAVENFTVNHCTGPGCGSGGGGASYSFISPLLLSGSSVSIPKADTSNNGYLSFLDWRIFNSKQSALGYTPEQVLTFNAPLSRAVNAISIDLSAYALTSAAAQTKVCTGTDKISGFDASTHQFTCTADQLGTSGGGITSLNGAPNSSQTFAQGAHIAIVTDTSTGVHTFSVTGLATVGTSGSYLDLLNLPSLGTAAAHDTGYFLAASSFTRAGVMSLWTTCISGYLKYDGSCSLPSASDVGLGNVSNDLQTKAAIMPNTPPTQAQIPVGVQGGGSYGPVSLTGDCTLAYAGAINCTKSGGATLTSLFDALGAATAAQAAAIASAASSAAALYQTILPAGQVAALPGTSGTPGVSNKYVTDNDSRNSNARTPTTHAATHASGGSDPITLNEAQITNLVSDLSGKQPSSANLTIYAGIPPSTNAQELLADTYAQMLAAIGAAAANASTAVNGQTCALGSTCTIHDATVANLNGVPFCTGFNPTNGQVVEYTTGSSPNPCYTAATAGGGIGGATTIGGGLINSSGTLTTVGQQPYTISFGLAGYMPGAQQFITNLPTAVNYSIPVNCTGSFATLGITDPSSYSITLYKNGTSFGTITFAGGSGTATWACSAATFAAGVDTLTTTGQTNGTPTGQNLGVTIYALR